MDVAKQTTARILAIALLSVSVVACGQQRARTAAARAEFHERFNAGQFHEIYAASALGDRAFSSEEEFVKSAGLDRRDYGKFEKDQADGPAFETKLSYDGYEIVFQGFNTRYSTYPIAEYFQWKIKGDQVRLFNYQLYANSEHRCERTSDCKIVQLGPVAEW